MRSGERMADLVRSVGAVVVQPPVALSNAELADRILGLLQVVDRLQAQVVADLGEFDTRNAWTGTGQLSTKTWLQAFGRLSGPAARNLVRAAATLPQLPELAGAFASGEVSLDHVRKLVDLHADVGPAPLAEVESTLTALARTTDPGQLQQACDHVRHWVNPDGAEPTAVRRSFTLARTGTGWLARGWLDPEAGATLQTALDAFTVAPVPGDGRDAPTRRHDALVEIARHSLREGRAPTVGGVRPSVGMLLPFHLATAADTTEISGEAPLGKAPLGKAPLGKAGFGSWFAEPAWLDWYGPVNTETARRILCDSDVYRVILDPATGLPLDVGRAYRLAPPWLRKLLWVRDRTCRFPGCKAPIQWTDAHHVLEWKADHGPTALDNLLSLCRGHHVLVHEHGWKLDFDHQTGQVHVTRPDGTPYELGRTHPYNGTTRRPPP